MIYIIKEFFKELKLLIINIFNIKEIEEKNNNKYIAKEYLLTTTELKFYKILKQITDELNLVICPQVAMYGILNSENYKSFNKISRKTIDFVIAEQNLKIKLCIELDDYTHNRQRRIQRDIFVNEIFKTTNVKILRIPVQNFYNKEELKNKIKESL